VEVQGETDQRHGPAVGKMTGDPPSNFDDLPSDDPMRSWTFGGRSGPLVYDGKINWSKPPSKKSQVDVTETSPVVRTDSGNAELFAKLHGADLRYCYTLKRFLAFDGARWKPDDNGEAERCTKETVRYLAKLAAETDGDAERKALLDWATKCECAFRREAILRLVRSEISVPFDALDTDPWLFNVANCTLDLRTGGRRGHDRADLITKVAHVDYQEAAACPTWMAFLNRVMEGDQELIGFLQRTAGYCLTGDVSADAVWVLHGRGANGKTRFTGALQDLMGEYARSVNPELLLTSRNDGGANKASPDLMVLRGTRFALFAETDEGRTLSAAMLKRLSSTDRIAARGLHADACEFPPSHKSILMTNHRPRVRSADHGTWRRIFLVPFTVTIPDHEQDQGLRDKLRAELPGILAWAVRGCLDWQKRGGGRPGLAAPERVLAATKEYRNEEDVIAPFLEDACTLASGERIGKGELYGAYTDWAERNKERPEGSRTFNAYIRELEGITDTKSGSVRQWKGISLRGGAR
jgi:putative DNA primase/helicase